MSERITYTCKKCGWTASIVSEWPDIKPKRCMNRKCKTSFLKSPEDLKTDNPKINEGDK